MSTADISKHCSIYSSWFKYALSKKKNVALAGIKCSSRLTIERRPDERFLLWIYTCRQEYSYALFWLLLSVVLPLTVVTICYVNIYLHYKRSRTTLLAYKTDNRHNHHRRRHTRRRQCIATSVTTTTTKTYYACQSQSLLLEARNHQQFASSDDKECLTSSTSIADHCALTEINNHDGSSPNNTHSTSNDGSYNNKTCVEPKKVASNEDKAERKLLFSLILVLAAFVVCWWACLARFCPNS